MIIHFISAMLTRIYFDLETTGLGRHAGIIHIGAVHEEGRRFSCFMVPDQDITPGATRVNGISKYQSCLYRGGNKIQDAVSPEDGLGKFLRWLQNRRTAKDEKFILVAHNGYNFDGPVLINNFLNHGVADLETLKSLIAGVGDSLVSFRMFCRGPYNLQSLLLHYGIHHQQTHDALDDAMVLKELVEVAEALDQFIIKFMPVGRIELRDKTTQLS